MNVRTQGLAALAAVALLGATPTTVAAAPSTTRRAPTDGVDRTWHDFSSEGDASSLELNPALLSDIKGADFVLRGYRGVSRYSRGTGFGGFFGVGFGFGVAMAFGVQQVQPRFADGTFDYAALQNPTATKVSWGLSLGDGEVASLGLGVHGLRTDGAWLRRPDVDVGVLLRLSRYLSLGSAARFGPTDLEASSSLPPELRIETEASVRPLGHRALELAGGFSTRFLPDGSGDPLAIRAILPRGRIALRRDGIALRGEIEGLREVELDSSLARVRETQGLRGSVSVEAAWDFMSVGGGVHTGLSDGVDGFDAYAHFSSSRQGRVVTTRPVAAERIELSKVKGQRELIRTIERLDRAAEAGSRAVILLDARDAKPGVAAAHELREAVIRVRNAGGHVFAYMEGADLGDYYLASAAEHVLLHPAGELSTYGLASSRLYFGDALKRIGVNVEAMHIAEYKSAHEMLTQDGPSKYDVEQRQALMAEHYTLALRDIAQARGLDVAETERRLSEAPIGPDDAKELGLIDDIVHRDEVLERMSEVVGTRVTIRELPDTRRDRTWTRDDYIAVVLVEGAIVDGESQSIPFLNIHYTGGDTIAETLRRVRGDRRCRGIVLRVDSPGGSALASDIIWREVERTQAKYKEDPRSNPPIVVSMSNVAASGGYYVAVGADTILADAATVTGSIGVVSMHFDISGLLEKLGIGVSTLKRGHNGDIGSPYKPYTADQRERLQASMTRIYDLFRARVHQGRGLELDRIHELARGRVWTGRAAQEHQLVDKLGGLREAVAMLRKQSKVPESRELELRILPKDPDLLDLILDAVGNPFGGAGLIARKARARADAKKKLPLRITDALARIPLALLLLPSNDAMVVWPWADAEGFGTR